MSELWDVYTIDRKKNGKICARGEQENLLNDEFHLWVMVWIKNPKTGKYLVSQRSADKDTDPLKWETVAGHSIAGDTSLDAALREVFEEVGIMLEREKATVLATKVALTYDGFRHNWIRDSYYFETTEGAESLEGLQVEETQAASGGGLANSDMSNLQRSDLETAAEAAFGE